MANHLAGSTSPYLLQHQHNPVDWYPWGDEALGRAAAENRPIFLSVGYAACHWCHVMERESFEDPEIAAILNEHFICIKVDREERPDLDQIYMMAVQMLTGSGGWPMNVFLLPNGKPFFGGTYWPPRQRQGMPGFNQIVMAIRDAWQESRSDIDQQAEALTGEIQRAVARPGTYDNDLPQRGASPLSKDLLFRAGKRLLEVFDPHWGGFGGAPKFPHCGDLDLLMRLWSRTQEADYLKCVTTTLQRMAAGGIYDHLGGGFARYSVDRQWLVPHFEKMLYDNGQLAESYLRAFQITGQPEYALIAEETLDYIVRDLSDEGGGLHSSEDADSEGVEGKYYVWTHAEIGSVLGTTRGEQFCAVYGVTPRGNFEGFSILHLPQSINEAAERLKRPALELRQQLIEDRQKLLKARATRIRPGRDDKVLTSWNALVITPLVLASRLLERPDFLRVAERITEFLLTQMRGEDGRLLRAFRDGHAHLPAYLDDYAYLANALIDLFETTGEPKWLEESLRLANEIDNLFRDSATGALYYTARDHESLIARAKDYTDASVPSAAGRTALAWLRLSMLTGDTRWHAAAEAVLLDAATLMDRQPAAVASLLQALDLYLGPTQQVVALAAQAQDFEVLWPVYFGRFRPRCVLVPHLGTALPHAAVAKLLAGKTLLQDQPTVYLCEHFRCMAPRQGFDRIDE